MTDKRPSTPSLGTQLDILFARKLVICGICGEPVLARDDCQWDHVHAHGLGGKDEILNLRPVHYGCHKSKSKADVHMMAKMQPTRADKFAVRKLDLDQPRPEKRFGFRR